MENRTVCFPPSLDLQVKCLEELREKREHLNKQIMKEERLKADITKKIEQVVFLIMNTYTYT